MKYKQKDHKHITGNFTLFDVKVMENSIDEMNKNANSRGDNPAHSTDKSKA